MLYKFDNESEVVGMTGGTNSIEELESETMLFSAGLEFAMKNGGPLTQKILNNIPVGLCPASKHIVVDTRAHMLMKKMYPAIPGWHGDGFPRSNKGGQPSLNSFDPGVEHFTCTLSSNNNGTSNTQFADSPVELDIWESNVWKSVDMQMGEKFVKSKTINDGHIMKFNQNTLHRAMPCEEPGWRLFFRLSFYHSPPLNKIRRQAQVYTTENQGW